MVAGSNIQDVTGGPQPYSLAANVPLRFMGLSIDSLTYGNPKGAFGSGHQTDEVTEPGIWRQAERFYGFIGIDAITKMRDRCGHRDTYAIGNHQNDLVEYLMKFGGQYSGLILRGLGDSPGPVKVEIYVDGLFKANPAWDKPNNCNQDVALDIPDIPYGTHAIAVKFVNDFFRPPLDRNLYLDALLVTR
jgi:hypothetical protein